MIEAKLDQKYSVEVVGSARVEKLFGNIAGCSVRSGTMHSSEGFGVRVMRRCRQPQPLEQNIDNHHNPNCNSKSKSSGDNNSTSNIQDTDRCSDYINVNVSQPQGEGRGEQLQVLYENLSSPISTLRRQKIQLRYFRSIARLK